MTEMRPDAPSSALDPGSPAPPIPDGPQSPVEALSRVVQSRGSQEGLVGRSGRLTWSEVDRMSGNVAMMLVDHGVRPGDRVACSLYNDVDIGIAFFGVLRAGAVWVGINPQLAPPEKRYILEDCGAVVMISSAGVHAAPTQDGSRVVLLVDDPVGPWSRARTGVRDVTALPDCDPFAVAAIAYTSGTTGQPKGAVHAHRNLVLPVVIGRYLRPEPVPSRMGQCLPLSILNLMILGPLAAAINGATFVAMDRVDADGVVDWVGQEQIDTFIGAAPLIHDLILRDDIEGDDLASVTRAACGGADFPEWYRGAWESKFNTPIEGGYGMTEAPTAVTTETDDSRPLGSCGKASPHVRITIRDDQGDESAVGTTGEVCIEPNPVGPFAHVYTPMLGYWNRPEATASALAGHRYHTGDVGHLDNEGWLYISARRSDLILRGGANVYPAEVERVLADHPQVTACAVIGRPHQRLGQEIVAICQLSELSGTAPDIDDELRALCASNLAKYKVPAEFMVIDDMPRNQMGKISKPALQIWLTETHQQRRGHQGRQQSLA
ncbi:MAG TPA: class I adenylate-forming enzyme family protein [Acidimicrobiales bacterium]|nr:class I adenylate-forming enzyme family protein [Acidimicrobiales bacterium]